jgi:hypothetical protein
VRRAFVADVTKNVYWAAINRTIFTVGCAIAISWLPHKDGSGLVYDSSLVVSFAIAFFPRVALTGLRKLVQTRLGVTNTPIEELDIQLVQGIDVWEEARLEEEGIENVQNLATTDALSLAVRTHYSLRTILDWIDQAILIQRYPTRLKLLLDSGLAMSAVELCLIDPETQGELIKAIAAKLQIDPEILRHSIRAMREDVAIQNIWDFWQTDERKPQPQNPLPAPDRLGPDS